ncbi:MAG: hypothetical protein CM1200mP26_02800 [Acidimicrobiales bacterium]|nr:MAG: hypothetical protein CM1200mP26_02800 [Acidimicrobiales bacterium]
MMVFTRDLRIHDNPALAAAWRESAPPVTLFVLDDGLLDMPRSPTNRLKFLADSLRDLDHSLRTLGGQLLVRRGDWNVEVMAAATEVGASTIHLSNDHSSFASTRLQRLELNARRHGLRYSDTTGSLSSRLTSCNPLGVVATKCSLLISAGGAVAGGGLSSLRHPPWRTPSQESVLLASPKPRIYSRG